MVNNSLGGFTPIIDSTGKITGYKTKVGADTVFPFSSAPTKTQTVTNTINNASVIFTFNQLTKVVGVVAMTAEPTTGYSATNFYIESISGNTVTAKIYRANVSAPYSVQITAIGY